MVVANAKAIVTSTYESISSPLLESNQDVAGKSSGSPEYFITSHAAVSPATTQLVPPDKYPCGEHTNPSSHVLWHLAQGIRVFLHRFRATRRRHGMSDNDALAEGYLANAAIAAAASGSIRDGLRAPPVDFPILAQWS
uniref:Uncharacterized protein n=1 Tax=Odontella aurita TaxID=265563 RepID=A0A7S4J168_9STRA|mmetsp:Transcript_35481/g.105943  ORF Transcript_35481/g.105943 Transcript_35481/m.105943 type:complete len:138 (+) Transcript_35481:47-460(+)